MRAMAFSTFGPPEVLRLTELVEPQAGASEVRVRIKAAGVMPYDYGVRSGWTLAGYTMTFPEIPGNEFAGIIDQVGEGVSGFSVGDEVLGFNMLKCYAEYVAVKSDQIVIKPENMPWEVAGGFSGNGQGAHLALTALGSLEGDTVLIHGAAGGLGTFAVQLAKLWGAATVIGTASESNHDYLRSLGAIPVSYGEGLVDRVRALAQGGVDAALDVAGPEALRASMELVKSKERIRTMVSFDLANELGIRPIIGTRTAARLAVLCDLYAQGKLHIHIRKVFPLDQAASAHREVESRHGRGKVVLTVN
ncbi:NADP-dependent oxidoreductase [Paenibacillus prosopidis]|uniref:NADPH:quinone reductase-like Zn-dependent oxidoreductase n=1 Tax=Paenibacillus prosopidis TaxID=630520 RepID=A0A368W0F0_9BACL|nr:NADP-dependent oxidoreductase [Paenibacillus prosopidis]RCW47864.1 NADPH:quinone reductase-like Zn-dependent oxidoreductase [Paenibacillus prosopidis]